MNLIDFAHMELEAIGLFRKDSDYGGMLGDAVIELIRVFAAQGHSGMSAEMVASLFSKLSRFEPLAPLTGKDDEWIEIDVQEFQNRRCSRVFKKNGQAYDIHGRVFEEPDGSRYTSFGSRANVVFPYTPHTEYVPATLDWQRKETA